MKLVCGEFVGGNKVGRSIEEETGFVGGEASSTDCSVVGPVVESAASEVVTSGSLKVSCEATSEASFDKSVDALVRGSKRSFVGPQTSQVKLSELAASLRRSSEGISSAPIAPAPDVGMNPIIAKRTVLIDHEGRQVSGW